MYFFFISMREIIQKYLSSLIICLSPIKTTIPFFNRTTTINIKTTTINIKTTSNTISVISIELFTLAIIRSSIRIIFLNLLVTTNKTLNKQTLLPLRHHFSE